MALIPASRLPPTLNPRDWKALGGKSRDYVYVGPDTTQFRQGDTISRRQYDRRAGSLLKRGVVSYERGAAATPPEVRLSRPAKGRSSAKNLPKTILTRGPLYGRPGRSVNIAFDPVTYNRYISAAMKNPKTEAVFIKANVENADKSVDIPIERSYVIDSAPSFSEIVDYLEYKRLSKSYPFTHVNFLTLYFRYFDQYVTHRKKSLVVKPPHVTKKHKRKPIKSLRSRRK